ncbi:MAG: RsmE family RNA methyltransferase [SAR86 cluster bacterium]|nr:16S rRNA (uracil(1498)-N(3))-methyltransferase [Gammaproteobacteria bacterium]MDG2347279.1 RsmE family RNA methyltransferase [SAR86 cluster bacterium]
MRSPRIFCSEISSPMYQCTNIKQIHHLAKVLRLGPTDPVELFDGHGSIAKGTIESIAKISLNIKVEDILLIENPYKKYYQAVIPYLKKENFMFMATKLVETGVNSIAVYRPHQLDQSLAKKDLSKLHSRLEESIIHACEQSECNFMPKIQYFDSLEDCMLSMKTNSSLESVFVLDTIADKLIIDQKDLAAANVTFVTGPESGFSDNERKAMKNLNLKKFKIGHYILRAETAPVVALSKLHSLFGEC